jgi:DNA-binding NtrC family response regulator
MKPSRHTLSAVADAAMRCPALIGSSAAIGRARKAVRLAARTDASVLVIREAGCCGGIVARTIHEASARAKFPFVPIECESVDALTLISSFGRKRADADAQQDGTCGTVFLDGLDRIPMSAQKALAEGLELGRPGGPEHNARVIAGTRDDLRVLLSEGSFRYDLYYNLAVLVVEIPPLRKRREDIRDLLDHCVGEAAEKMGRPMPSIPRRLVELSEGYSWPGNLRELRCVAARLVASYSKSKLDLSALPEEIRNPQAPEHEPVPFQLPPEGVNLDVLERHLIGQALERHGGNRTHAARALGLSRQTLLYRMQKHGYR